ncbi:hypothetical protein OAU03_01255 [Luminiphilus sp.]|nr:hypothetical protein [Luminiphilus sp.]
MIVGKIGGADIESRAPHWLFQIATALASGTRVFVDYTDHHLETKSVMTPFYEKLCLSNCDFVVPTTGLAQMLRSKFESLALHVIEDWLEYDMIAPKIGVAEITKALWFGHPSNARFLIQLLHIWPATTRRAELNIVSSPQILDILNRHSFSKKPNVKVSYIPWSLEVLPKLAKDCHCAVIPSDLKSAKRFASSNRLVTALALGLPTVATPLSSYKEFEKYFSALSAETLAQVLEAPNSHCGSVSAFQSRYAKRFTLDALSSQWQKLII